MASFLTYIKTYIVYTNVLLLLSIPFKVAASPAPPIEKREFVPFQHQSQSFSFNEWVLLFTLCFAPLAMHVITGAPEPSVLEGKDPTWMDKLPLFNPISIMWRYHAIADRRLRANTWTNRDMAATNAAFWKDQKWLRNKCCGIPGTGT